jgi:hypothetical protein
MRVEAPLVVADGEFVADRVEATGVRVDDGQPIAWVENRIYKVSYRCVIDLWPAGGPQL